MGEKRKKKFKPSLTMEITGKDGKEPPAEDVLRAAQLLVKLLKSIDKDLHGKVTTKWIVQIKHVPNSVSSPKSNQP